MAQGKTFRITVECSSGVGPAHQHELEIAAEKHHPLGALSERTCEIEMQYTCPRSGEDRKVIFDSPPGFPRPYRIVSVA